MITAWIKNAKTPEEIDSLTNSILGSTVALDRLSALMQEDLDGMNNREVNTSVYDLPNWELRIADANGYRRCLRTYLNLLNLDQEGISNGRPVGPTAIPTPTV